MKVIGLTGFSGSGKDTFFDILRELTNGQVVRFALADKLKEELRDFLIAKFSIDILNCSRKEKDLVRPILITYSAVKRQMTLGKYFTSLLEEEINNRHIPENLVAVVTDIRFAFFPEDEALWLKKRMGGKLIRVERFQMKDGQQIFDVAPNKMELVNNPLIDKHVDFNFQWENFNDNISALKERYAGKILELYEKTIA